MLQIKQATKQQSKLRLAIAGPSGSGKTYTALRFAFALTGPNGKICVIDTERGSASKYVGEAPDGVPWQFDVIEPDTFGPDVYVKAIVMAYEAGYDVLVIDSLSHAWSGKGGALDIKDSIGGNSWAAWRKVTPLHDRMVDTILRAPMHVIATMRSKMSYVQETDPNTGKTVIRKVGMEPVQRAGMEYEFDVMLDMDWANIATVSKTRCPAITDASEQRPGAEFMKPLIAWLNDGAPSVPSEMAIVTNADPEPSSPPPPPPPPPPTDHAEPETGVSHGDSSHGDSLENNAGKQPGHVRAGAILHMKNAHGWNSKKTINTINKAHDEGLVRWEMTDGEIVNALLEREAAKGDGDYEVVEDEAPAWLLSKIKTHPFLCSEGTDEEALAVLKAARADGIKLEGKGVWERIEAWAGTQADKEAADRRLL